MAEDRSTSSATRSATCDAQAETATLIVSGGWKSRAMLDRSGRSAVFERAKSAYRRFSPGDRI